MKREGRSPESTFRGKKVLISREEKWKSEVGKLRAEVQGTVAVIIWQLTCGSASPKGPRMVVLESKSGGTPAKVRTGRPEASKPGPAYSNWKRRLGITSKEVKTEQKKLKRQRGGKRGQPTGTVAPGHMPWDI